MGNTRHHLLEKAESQFYTLLSMGWYEEFQKTIGEAVRQINGSGHPVHTTASPRTGEVSLTKNVQVKMKQWGLSEADALDVYHHGSVVKNNMMVRKHNGYEIGIWYFADRVTGKAIISSVWKRGSIYF